MGYTRFVGEIQAWPLLVIPPGWALCDGSLLESTRYGELFSLIGQRFGGDGSMFALPDLRGRTPYGASRSASEPLPIGARYGSATVALDSTNLPAHRHNLRASAAPASAATIQNALPASTAPGDPVIYAPYAPDVALDPDCIRPTGSSQPHDNMQPGLGLNFIIALVGTMPDQG